MVGRSYFYCFLGIFFFSTYEIVGKLFGTQIPPVAITSLRFFIGSLVLAPFALFYWKRKPSHIGFSDLGKMAIPIVLNVAVSMLFLHLSVIYGKASLAAILISSNPLFVGIFAWLLLKEPVSKLKIAGIFVGLAGMIMVVLGEKTLFSGSKNIYLGIFFGLISSVTFALYTVLSKKHVLKFGSLVFNSISFMIGSLVLLLIGIIGGFQITFQLSTNNILALLYLGIFVSGIGYFLFFEGLQNIPTANGSMFFYLKPFIASTLAFFILQEKIYILQILGVFVVILGLNLERLFTIRSRFDKE